MFEFVELALLLLTFLDLKSELEVLSPLVLSRTYLAVFLRALAFILALACAEFFSLPFLGSIAWSESFPSL